MTVRLPSPVDFDWDKGWGPCPWCRADVLGATVTLEQLVRAHDADALRHAPLDAANCARAECLTAECGECGGPFAVTLRLHRQGGQAWAFVRLLPVRRGLA